MRLPVPGCHPHRRYVEPWLGAFHGANEQLFWHTDQQQTSAEVALGKRMVAHWSAFVREHHPLPPWPAYAQSGRDHGGTERDRYLLLGKAGDVAGAQWHTARCDALDHLRVVWNPPTGWPSSH